MSGLEPQLDGDAVPVPSTDHTDAAIPLFERLATITTDRERGADAQIGGILQLLADGLALGLAFLARVEGETLHVMRAYDRADMGLGDDTRIPLHDTYCQVMLADDAASLVVEDARAAPRFADLATTRDLGIGAYSGVPLHRADGTLYGTLCTLHPHARSLREGELGLLRLAGRLVMQAVEAAELREREARYRALTEHGSDLVCILDSDGAARYGSPSYTRVLGAPIEELHRLAGSPLAVIHPDDRAQVRAALRACVRDNCPALTLTCRHRHADGSWRTLEAIVSNRLDDPAIGGIIVTSRDITAHKAAEAALRASEERFRAMLAHSPVGAAVADEHGIFEFVNDTYANSYGYTPAEMVGQPVTMLMEPERRAALAATYADYVARGAAVRDEYAVVTRSGERRTVLGQSVQYAGPDGRPRRATFSVDITERVRLEAALRASEERYRQVEQHAPTGLSLVAPDGRFVRVNPALCALVGYSEEELLARTFQDITHPDDLDADLTMVGRMLTGEIATYQMEKRYIRKDGSFVWILLSVSLVRGEAGQPLYTIAQIQDIDARKQAEEALAHSNHELARSNAELQRFTSVASHDLRSPLSSIAGFAQLLQLRYRDRLDEQADQYIDFITGGVARMQALIDALLNYARLDSRATLPASVEGVALVHNALANLHAAIMEAGATVTVAELPTVMGDAAQLGQLVQNLLANALKFRRPDVAPQIYIEAERTGAHWTVAVRDNGIGIDPAQAGRIFEMFGRLHTREEYEGTGIGLAICQKIVERHGGRIWVESMPGEGATFRFTLPAV